MGKEAGEEMIRESYQELERIMPDYISELHREAKRILDILGDMTSQAASAMDVESCELCDAIQNLGIAWLNMQSVAKNNPIIKGKNENIKDNYGKTDS